MVNFDEATHTYTTDEGKKLISVTQLMQKHNLSPSYSNVNTDVLKAKAEYGTLVHKEIENYIKDGELGFTSELGQFIDYITDNNVKVLNCEFMVHNDIVAGTVDLLTSSNGKTSLDDNKTTAVLHKEAVSWQLGIYTVLAEDMFKIAIDENKINHFTPDGLKVVEIKRKSREEVERLFECERKGEIYKPIAVNEVVALSNELAVLEDELKAYKVIQERYDSLKGTLYSAMENNDVRKWTTPTGIQISRVDATESKTTTSTETSFNEEKFKAENEELYNKYVESKEVTKTTSGKKGFLRITLPKEKENE